MAHGQFAIIPARAIDDVRFDQNPKYLQALLILGTYADRDGWCFPSLSEVGKRMKMGRSTVSRLFHDLERWGYLLIVSKMKSDGSREVNRYRILHDKELPEKYDRGVPQTSVDAEQGVPQTSVVVEQGVQSTSVKTGNNVPMNAPIKLSDYSSERKETELSTFDEKIDELDKDVRRSKPKVFPPTTPLAKYLAETAKFGTWKWDGFQSAGERDGWGVMEMTYKQEDIKSAIDWAVSMRFGKKQICARIFAALKNNKQEKPKKEIGKAVVRKDGSLYV